MPTWMVQKRIAEVEVVGFSVAGEETVIGLPELNVAFDVGRAPREIISIDTVCISHGHQDHAAGVVYYFSQRGFVGIPPGRVIIHRALAQTVQSLMAVWADLERHPTEGQIIGIEHGQDFELRRDLVVRAYDVPHSFGSLGFSVIEKRRKLKPEFTSLSGPQLVELKKKGVEIQNEMELSLASYTGDTAAGPFIGLDHVRNAKMLFLECTFFDREHVTRARAGKHLHVSDLRAILRNLNCPQIVLVHVTRRTDLREAKQILAEAVDKSDLDRLTFLMERPRRNAGPNTSRGPAVV